MPILREICEKLRSKEIILDKMNHSVNCELKRMLEIYDHKVALSNGLNDGKWGESEITDAGMREHFSKELNREINQEDTINSLSDRLDCRNCGERLQWVFSGKKLKLKNYIYDDSKMDHLDLRNHKCDFTKPEPHAGIIQITNKLVFGNYFREFGDTPKELEFDKHWSLSSFAGRNKITNHLCRQNIAFGQMSNMSVTIYVHSSKESIIIGPDDEKYDSYKKLGTISLAVWRWQATDLDTLGKRNYDKIKKDQDLIAVDVPYGAWKFTHYFDLPNFEKNYDQNIYSKFELQ